MSQTADVINAATSVLWVGLAFLVFVYLRAALKARFPYLSKFGLGASGVTMEFAEQRLNEAISRSDTAQAVGDAAKRGVLARLDRNADLLKRARLIWVDDHPENNTSIIDLLRKFGASVDTPRSNQEALAMLRQSFYDVVVSDVGRDSEGERGHLAGIDLAAAVHAQWGRQVILFTTRFNPANLPGIGDEDRLALVRTMQETVFGSTNRYDEALHLILDFIERSLL